MKHIESIEQFNELVRSKKDFLLLKHSDTCGISQKAMEEYREFIEDDDDFGHYYLVVQLDRDVSDFVAKKLGVKHESPQMFLFRKGELVWHDSHYSITADEIKKHVQT